MTQVRIPDVMAESVAEARAKLQDSPTFDQRFSIAPTDRKPTAPVAPPPGEGREGILDGLRRRGRPKK